MRELHQKVKKALKSGRSAGLPDIILKRCVSNPCTPKRVLSKCAQGHETERLFACTKRSCKSKVCLHHAREQRQKLVRPLMLDVFGAEWGVLVLPYTPRCRDWLRFPDLLAAWRQCAASRVQDVILFMHGLDPDEGWRLGMISTDHPCGENSDEWVPHHNFYWPCVAFHPSGQRRPIRYWLEPEELEILRAEWLSLQEQLCGQTLETAADIGYEFRRGGAKLHAAEYFSRTFPDWPPEAQRLSYMGAFGCATLHQLPEVAKLKHQAKQEARDLKACGTCKGEIVKWECFDGSLPRFYQPVQQAPPSG